MYLSNSEPILAKETEKNERTEKVVNGGEKVWRLAGE